MQAGRQLERLMAARGLSQADVAREAKVSQPTVSRLLRLQPQRSGAAYLRLCGYIQQEFNQLGDGGPYLVFDAVRRVWDGSDRHAAALTALIEASARLWPDLANQREPPSRAQSTSGRD